MNRQRELLVGAVIIIAVVVTVVGTLWLQGTNFGRLPVVVEVLLESAGQLSEGNVVTYRGVRIGRVDGITVEPGGGAVRVTMHLEPDVTLPVDAAVVLGPESLFGGWQAEIVSRASFERFPFFDLASDAQSTPRLLAGYALPEISRLTASAEQISQNLADNLSNAIANIEAITQEVHTLVREQSVVATRITASTDSALAEVELAARTARRSFEEIESVVTDAQLDSILSNLSVASVGLRTVANELSDPDGGLSATLGRADSAFIRVDRIAAGLEAGEGSLGRLLTDTAFALRAENVLMQLDLLLQDVRENPRRYVRLSIF